MTVTARHPGVVRIGGRLMVVDPFAERGELTDEQANVRRLRRRLTLLFGGFLVFVALVIGGLIGAFIDAVIAPGNDIVLSMPIADPDWVPGVDVIGAIVAALLTVFLLITRQDRLRRRDSLRGGHQPSRWVDPLNDHLIGLDDDVSWTGLWTLTRMYAAAERAQREFIRVGAAQPEVGSECDQVVADARFAANDTRAALEKTAVQMGVLVPEGPLPDAQAILANSARQRGRATRKNLATGL
ncbi:MULTISPECIES: hypothetical protein [unclassified Plantibacter]|uniref:hypothetical protein n=1 Tax=unclassified Plantibacter TaxID=2624265 RepID=UPI003D352FAD